MPVRPDGASIVRSAARRHTEIVDRLLTMEAAELEHGSRLPGWDRLTIACHLRYGAIATERMTADTLDGRATAYYPDGRNVQRPGTLRPAEGESTADVIAGLDRAGKRLEDLWRGIDGRQWSNAVVEPSDNTDLGSIDLWTLALLRLTEVEVHGGDLDIGLSPWSSTFVSAALPQRLEWLPTRRSNHRSPARLIDGIWALVSTDGPSFVISAQGLDVSVEKALADGEINADAVIAGPSDRLLAFILGRAPLGSLEVRGEKALAHGFLDAFPAP